MAKTLVISINRYVAFIGCLLLMIVVPIAHSHKLFGHSTGGDEKVPESPIVYNSDGSYVVNTTTLAQGVMGYGGPTPLEIEVSDGRVVKITPLENNETPEFFGAIRNSDMLESLDGLTLEEASTTPVDGVTGATFSSTAVIGNIRAGIEYALKEEGAHVEAMQQNKELPVKFYFTLAIVLLGAVVPLFLRNRRYRTLQLLLNVGILGFWGGTFISYSLMVSYLTNGITSVLLIPTVIMLLAAFVYPMFGKSNYYCLWMCPYGSLQELLGKCVSYKIPVSNLMARRLKIFRELLWFVLMWLLWTGLCFDWMGLEPFAAFFFGDASIAVLIIAGVFLVLSIFIPRPYCRWVCPTGTLFKFAEGN